MIPELGLLATIAALALSLLLGIFPLWGAQKDRAELMQLARPLTWVMVALLLLAYAALTHAFVVCDFSVAYVARNANTGLPLAYRIAAVWGGHEGSMLLWVAMLGMWMLAVAAFSRHLPLAMVARILAVMGWTASGFLLFMLLTSNPFERLLPVPAEGRDLNPLLQDPGMVAHPPMLYMGYVGFSVAFAFAVAALLGGQLNAQWARWSRPWTTAAWACLTIGIMLGSWWAYYELGWGGWWFWDPVENASFMPWLAGTALIHSLAVTEKRNSFKSWTVLLAITTFSLSLLGTFLVRSGVLSSVHAFATDPSRGMFILCFLLVVVGGSLLLYAWRAPSVGLGQRFGVISKETSLLVNNVLLIVAMAAVLLGTLYPLFLDALGVGKISVGPPYFDAIFVPLMVPLVFLMGIGPVARWKNATVPELAIRLRWAMAVSVAAALLSGWLAGRIGFAASLGLWMAYWVASTVVLDAWHQMRPVRVATSAGAGYTQSGWRKLRVATVGMMMAHLGVAMFAFGVSMVKAYEVEKDIRMHVGDTAELAGYTFSFRDLQPVEGPNYQALQGLMEVTRGDEQVATLHPQKRVYRVQTSPMTEAAIDAGFTRDLYVSMGEQLPDGAWIVRIHYKPFVNWIWLGCVVMALGGVLAITDRRYRQRQRAADAATEGAIA